MTSMSDSASRETEMTINNTENDVSKTKCLQIHGDDADSIKNQNYELVPDHSDGGYGWVTVFAVALQCCIGLWFVSYLQLFE